MHPGGFGQFLMGKSGVNSGGLCLRENQQGFFENILSGVLFIWAVASLHSMDFIAYHNFCYTYHAKTF